MTGATNKIVSRLGPSVYEAFEIKISTAPDYIYHPGDLVTGTVTLATTSKKDLTLEITLYGLGYVRWTEGQGKNTVIYKGRDDLFKVCTSQPVSTERFMYPFTMQIPDISMLPRSSAVEHGYVQYGVDAVVKMPGMLKPRDNKVTVSFLLQSRVHPILVTRSRNPDYFENAKTEEESELKADLCCFPLCWQYYCGEETVKISLTTKPLWAFIGAEIPYSFSVENNQKEREVKNIRIQLVGCWTRRVKNNCLWYKRMLERKETFVCEETVHPIFLPPGESLTSQGVMKVPLGVDPIQVECNVLRLTYHLQARLDERTGMRCCIKGEESVKVDVLVASEPVEPDEFSTTV